VKNYLVKLILATASLILYALGSTALSQSVAAPRPFSVRDSIGFVRIGAIDNEGNFGLLSPAGQRVAFVSHQGDLTKNVVMDTLFFFETGEVKSWLASGGDDRRRPAPAVAARIPVASSAEHISDIRWLGDHALSFIAGDEHGTRQVFRYDLRIGENSQLTHWATDVTTYALAGDELVFYATSEGPQPASMPVGDRSWEEFVKSASPADKVVGLYVLSLKTGVVQAIAGSRARLLEFNQHIWLSPNGKFAVTLAPATNAPSYWSQYHVSNYDLFGYTADRASLDPTSEALLYRTRYALIDLQIRSIRPLRAESALCAACRRCRRANRGVRAGFGDQLLGRISGASDPCGAGGLPLFSKRRPQSGSARRTVRLGAGERGLVPLLAPGPTTGGFAGRTG
jgi:hypothetical protein